MSASRETGVKTNGRTLYYGWVVVGISTFLLVVHATVFNGMGVFFKPLVADFGWSRAATSGMQSILLLCMGAFSIPGGWLADKFGPARVLAICGLVAGVGLILTSRVTALWQIYLTYSVMVGIGLSCDFNVTGITTARWFAERRGLALGIVAAGIGLGNLVGVPTAARLIEAYGWSKTYFILGIGVSVLIVGSAYFLRRKPPVKDVRLSGLETSSPGGETAPAGKARVVSPVANFSVAAAVRTRTLWLIFTIFTLFTFCNQMLMVHLVNYATDMGVAPLVAATLVGVVGVGGIAGRMLMGLASDKIGGIKALVISCVGVAIALTWLIFARDLWMFYLFSIVHGFTYGAEVPQQTALVAKFFGLKVTLIGIVSGGVCLGGALGSWVGGLVFDATQSYHIAFLMAIGAVITALICTLVLGKRKFA